MLKTKAVILGVFQMIANHSWVDWVAATAQRRQQHYDTNSSAIPITN